MLVSVVCWLLLDVGFCCVFLFCVLACVVCGLSLGVDVCDSSRAWVCDSGRA